MKPTIQALKNKTSHDAPREFGGTLGETIQQSCFLCLLSKVCGFSPKIIRINVFVFIWWFDLILSPTTTPSDLTCTHLPGALFIPTLLPLTVLFLIAVSRSPEASVLCWPPPLPSAEQLWDPLAPGLLLGWITLHAVLYFMPLGKVWCLSCACWWGTQDMMFPPLFKLWGRWWTVCVCLSAGVWRTSAEGRSAS